ncbi:Cysteine desulfurase, mitochondrial [Myotis davidii]|uniref:cysteine desulfurase n=1 Tax=Myotis davidii TaxID=225400 RepID=L5LU57_MYODS|nr:Cysteine desulfurase, mitochondrial [Myotis davidii]
MESVLRPLYMDVQATTPLDPRVLDAMLPYLVNYYGNPHSRTHAYGWESEAAMERARQQVASLIGADPREIIFTSGATESNNIAIKGVARFYRSRKKHLITSQTEHKCVLDSCRSLEAEGFQVTYLPVKKSGIIDLKVGVEKLEQHGFCLWRICSSRKVYFHTDAAQAVGKIPLDVNDMKIDLMSISGHKIYGPKGVGAIYIRRRPRVRVEALQSGGGQERGMRSGTVPTPLVVGLGAACEVAQQEMEYDHKRISKLAERLIQKIMKSLPDVVMNGDPHHHYPGCINLSFAYVEGESLLMALKDVALSSGSACTSASLEPSYVLRAIGTDEDLAHSSIRFGIGRFTTEEEVDYTVEKCIYHVKRLREMSLKVGFNWLPTGLTWPLLLVKKIHLLFYLDIVEDSIYIAYGPNGKATGEGFVEFRNEADYKAALCRHKQYMGNRFIQVHPITKKGMLEKIDMIRKRLQNFNYDQREMMLNPEGDVSSTKVCAHITNIPFSITKMDVLQFLEGIPVDENAVHVLVDNNGQGLGQALVQFKNEDDARKSERLHRKKLNGREAFVHVVTLEDMREIEKNPPAQGKKGLKMPVPGGEEHAFLAVGSKEANNGPPFNFPGNFGGPNAFGPPLPPPGLGGAFGDVRPGMPSVGNSGLPGLGLDIPGFGGGPNNLSGPGFGGGPQNFGNGPGSLGGPPGFGSGPPGLGNAPGHLSGPPAFGPGPGPGPGPIHIGGPPGFGSSSGKPGPTVIKVQNMPFTVSIDEILDFFYGYQVIPGSVCLKYNEKGMPTGEAMVAFESRDEATAAVIDLNDRPIGSRKVKLVLG